MTVGDTGPSGGDPFDRWAADARAREAADSRVRERWMRQQAQEQTAFAGVLLDLAERRTAVVMTTTAGRRHRGEVAGVGDDFVALRVPAGHTVLIAVNALAEVRPSGGGVVGAAGRNDGLGVSLVDVLAQAAGHRPRLAVQSGEATMVGDLVAVGVDVLALDVDGAHGGLAYLRLSSVSEISLFGSG